MCMGKRRLSQNDFQKFEQRIYAYAVLCWFAPLSQARNINIFTLTHVSDVLARTLRADIEAGIKFSFGILIDSFRGWSEVKEDEEEERLPEVP